MFFSWMLAFLFFFFFSSRRRHTRCSRDWSSDVCSSDLRTCAPPARSSSTPRRWWTGRWSQRGRGRIIPRGCASSRSEEHTSELQSRLHLVCRLLLEKKKSTPTPSIRGHLCPHSATTFPR